MIVEATDKYMNCKFYSINTSHGKAGLIDDFTIHAQSHRRRIDVGHDQDPLPITLSEMSRRAAKVTALSDALATRFR